MARALLTREETLGLLRSLGHRVSIDTLNRWASKSWQSRKDVPQLRFKKLINGESRYEPRDVIKFARRYYGE